MLWPYCNSKWKEYPLLLHHCTNKISNLCDCLTKDSYSSCWSYCCIHSVVLCTTWYCKVYQTKLLHLLQTLVVSVATVVTVLIAYYTTAYTPILLYSYHIHIDTIVLLSYTHQLRASCVCFLLNICSVHLCLPLVKHSTIPQPSHWQLLHSLIIML